MNKKQYNAKGFTLVELLIGMVITLVLIGGSISVFIQNSRLATLNDLSIRTQDDLRVASELLARDVRMAGYFGCSGSPTFNNLLPNGLLAGEYNMEGLGVEGHEKSSSNWQPSGSAVSGLLSDAIKLRYFDGDRSIRITAGQSTLSSPIGISSSASLQQNEIVGITNCSNTDLVQIANDPSAANTISVDCASAADCYNTSNETGTEYINGFILKPVFVSYYISQDAGRNHLTRSIYAPDNGASSPLVERLIEGVDELVITYGEDTSGNGSPNSYVQASAVTDWENVVTVRYGMMVSSDESSESSSSDTVYDVNGVAVTVPANDRRIRKVIVNTVAIRNRTGRA